MSLNQYVFNNMYHDCVLTHTHTHTCTRTRAHKIIGPVLPIAATLIFPTNISHNSATIHWTVPAITYDTETYSLLCGTELNTLELGGPSLTSSNDIEDTNINLVLTLNGLQEQTLYYCRVQSTNGNGTTVSDGITSFTTRAQGRFTLHPSW